MKAVAKVLMIGLLASGLGGGVPVASAEDRQTRMAGYIGAVIPQADEVVFVQPAGKLFTLICPSEVTRHIGVSSRKVGREGIQVGSRARIRYVPGPTGWVVKEVVFGPQWLFEDVLSAKALFPPGEDAPLFGPYSMVADIGAVTAGGLILVSDRGEIRPAALDPGADLVEVVPEARDHGDLWPGAAAYVSVLHEERALVATAILFANPWTFIQMAP